MSYTCKLFLLAFSLLAAAAPLMQGAGDFSILVWPSTRTVQGEATVYYQVSIDSFSGFKSPVTLSLTSGLPSGATVSPPSCLGTGDFSCYFDVAATLTSPPGTYTLTFTGSSGSLVHSTTADLVVNPAPPDFSLSAAPASQTVTQGQNTTYTVIVTLSNGFSGEVVFTAGGLPAGTTASFNPPSVTGSGSSVMTVTTSGSTPAAPATLTITGTSGSLSHNTSVTLNVYVIGADFSLSVTPASQSIKRNETKSYTVTVTALNGFYGTVSFGVSGLPAGTTAYFFPSTVSGSGDTSMRVSVGSSTYLGTYPLTITGTSGSLSHSVPATLVVVSCYPYLNLSTPPDVTVVRGGFAEYPLLIDGECGFDDTVLLSVTNVPSGASWSFNPASMHVGGWGYTTLTVATTGATPEGTYTLSISGTSPSGADSSFPHLTVTGSTNKFSLSSSPTSQTVSQGYSKTYTITLTPEHGFSGDVAFTMAGLPYGATASFTPATLTASGDTTLRLTSGYNTPIGSYALSVVGTSESLRNYVNIELVVTVPIGALSGRVTQEDGQTPIAGATVEVYRNGSLLTTKTSDSGGTYTVTGLSPDFYALMCSAQGRKTYIQSSVYVSPDQTVTQDFALPLLPSTGPTMKEYIYLGSRPLAIEENPQEGVDFEQFTGQNNGQVALPPLAIGMVTFTGGQVYTGAAPLPGDTTALYGTFGPDANVPWGAYCNGCAGTVTIGFAQPVSGLSFLLLNGETYDVTYTVQDDLGAQVVVTLPPNWASGKAIIALPSAGIRTVTITSDAGNAWDFWVDDFIFTSGGGGAMPQQAAPAPSTQVIQPLPSATPGSASEATASGPTVAGGKK